MKTLKQILQTRLPKSIARQSQTEQPEPFKHESRASFETVLINGRMVKINKRLIPDDLPSHSDWFRMRVWMDEIDILLGENLPTTPHPDCKLPDLPSSDLAVKVSSVMSSHVFDEKSVEFGANFILDKLKK